MQKHLGDAAIEYGKQLKAKIKEKYSYYSKLQDEENKRKILRVLNKWYSILESRIQSNEFKSIEEISNDFISLEEKLNETFPTYNGKSELFNDFKTKIFAFAGQYFTAKAYSEKKISSRKKWTKNPKINKWFRNSESKLWERKWKKANNVKTK